jgi:aldose 1-epimerase
MNVSRVPFGTTRSGQQVTQFRCTNKHGYSVTLIDYGATVTTLDTPDRTGRFANIALGCKDIEGYELSTCYFGAIVGRVCNRIANASFNIDGEDFSLVANDGPNHLHGGLRGFDKVVWQSDPLEEADSVGVRFRMTSECGDEGYPGQLVVTAEYRLNNDNEMSLLLEASTSKKTHVNLTGHSYWNLGGATSESILNHDLMINADHYLPVNENLIPTGQLKPVDGTALDFRTTKTIGRDLNSLTNDPIGYDHCYIVNGDETNRDEGKLTTAAIATDPLSGRRMEILTTQPGLQFYTGNFLNGQASTNGFAQHSAFCLETQGYVDAANQPTFPSTLLKPGETYRHKTVHRFSVAE